MIVKNEFFNKKIIHYLSFLTYTRNDIRYSQ